MLLTFVFVDSYVSSTPNTTRIRMYEAHTRTRETYKSMYVCVCQNTERERERGAKRKKETVREHATISCSNVKQWKRDEEREMREQDGKSTRQSRASSWPSCFKMSSAFVYIEENLLLRSGKLRKRNASLSLSLAFFFLRGSFLSHPSFLALCLLPTPSVFLFSRRPLFNFRSLSHDATVSFSLSLSLPSFARVS